MRPTAPRQTDLPKQFGNKYLLLHHLASGGMADVFVARQSGPHGFAKECVIKRILPHLARDAAFVQMFLDEARLCARLNHPNIAAVYDLGQVGDDFFIAMEYVHGVDLEKILEVLDQRGEKRMPFSIAARVVASIADGLEHAHNAADTHGRPLGIVHRDVTPSNIVVSFDGVPKLLDFGIAKATAVGASRTDVGIVKGKAPYMSPEQVQSQPMDGRSDLFSLAAILYELTTGAQCWPGDNPAQTGVRILHDEPTPPSLLVTDYPPELEQILQGALVKRREERTASARTLQSQLDHFIMACGQPANSGDVARFLAERFPRERATLTIIPGGSGESPESLARITEAPTMADRQVRTTGELSLGEGPGLSELLEDRPDSGRRGGGGSGRWMVLVIVVLVALTGAGLYFLHGYEMKKESAQKAPVDPNTPAQQVTPPPAQANPPAQPNPPPAQAKVEPPAQPKVTPIEKPPEKVEAKAPEKAPEAKHPPKEHHHHPPGPTGVSLPHLPTPPPTDDGN